MTSVNLCMESFSLCSVSDDNAEDDNMSCNDGDGGDDTEGRTIDFGISSANNGLIHYPHVNFSFVECTLLVHKKYKKV